MERMEWNELMCGVTYIFVEAWSKAVKLIGCGYVGCEKLARFGITQALGKGFIGSLLLGMIKL